MTQEQKHLVGEYTATLAGIKEHLFYFSEREQDPTTADELKAAVENISAAIYSLMKGTWHRGK